MYRRLLTSSPLFAAATAYSGSLVCSGLRAEGSDAPAALAISPAPLAKKYKVGVLGATGTVGQQFLKHLENVCVFMKSTCWLIEFMLEA